MEKFSYSKISVMDKAEGGCPYKYKLIYVDKHFIHEDAAATAVGSLIHETEESILNQIKDSLFVVNIDYDFLIKNIKEKFTEIKNQFPEQMKQPDKSGRVYSEKIDEYIRSGIYRLENYFVNHPDLEPVAAEQEFEVEFGDYVFHGYIDRIFYDKATEHYIIEDIKTYAIPLEKSKLATPLQFVFYSLAVQKLFNVDASKIECAYDLPFCNVKQSAGTKGYLDRGNKKIHKLLAEIEAGHFEPNPSPLCHWCVFSKTYINGQPEEAKGLCPYFNHYKKAEYQKLGRRYNPNDVECEWADWENHDAVLKYFRESLDKPAIKVIELSKATPADTNRRLMIRR